MCYGCWINDFDSPSIITPATQYAAQLIAKVYDISSVGGNCHVVFDDWNIDDDTVDWCLDKALATNYHEHSLEELAVEREALDAFKRLSIQERASALAMHDGFIEEEQS